MYINVKEIFNWVGLSKYTIIRVLQGWVGSSVEKKVIKYKTE